MCKPLNPIFQNPFSRRGENPRGKDGRFFQQGQLEEDTEDLDVTAEHSERCTTPILEENVRDKILEMENTTISPVYGRGRRKLIRQKSRYNPNTRNGNKCKTNHRRRPERDYSSGPKR